MNTGWTVAISNIWHHRMETGVLFSRVTLQCFVGHSVAVCSGYQSCITKHPPIQSHEIVAIALDPGFWDSGVWMELHRVG